MHRRLKTKEFVLFIPFVQYTRNLLATTAGGNVVPIAVGSRIGAAEGSSVVVPGHYLTLPLPGTAAVSLVAVVVILKMVRVRIQREADCTWTQVVEQL